MELTTGFWETILSRIETGAIQFGEDWPGIFIRGDQALYYAGLIHGVIDHSADKLQLEQLLNLLESCHAATATPRKLPGWILSADKMPQYNKTVQIWDKALNRAVDAVFIPGWQTNEADCWISLRSGYVAYGVKYWRELPENPYEDA